MWQQGAPFRSPNGATPSTTYVPCSVQSRPRTLPMQRVSHAIRSFHPSISTNNTALHPPTQPLRFLSCHGNVTAPVPCSAGTHNPSHEATTDAVCVSCDAGTHSSAGAATCTPCAAGFYSTPQSTECSRCVEGTPPNRTVRGTLDTTDKPWGIGG